MTTYINLLTTAITHQESLHPSLDPTQVTTMDYINNVDTTPFEELAKYEAYILDEALTVISSYLDSNVTLIPEDELHLLWVQHENTKELFENTLISHFKLDHYKGLKQFE